ncbi:MAG: universal stress protein [Bacteroidia bacterium]|nr:universal stress protein [Bacteroidia bacterium]
MSILNPSIKKESLIGENQRLKTILFPTDFSETAHNAFEYALNIADHIGANIVLLHVYQEANAHNGYIPTEILQSLKEEKLEKAINFFHEYQREAQLQLGKSIEVRPILQSGVPENIIPELSRSMDVDLIIMGTLGAASVSERILGSVTAKVIEKAGCPVMAIPAECTYKPINRILYGMRMDENEFGVIDQLVEFAGFFDAKVYCTHVRTDKEYWSKLELNSFEHLYHLENEGKLQFYVFNHEDVVRGLRRFIDENGIDILSLTTQKRDLIDKFFDQSLTREMVLYTDIPLLAFHG